MSNIDFSVIADTPEVTAELFQLIKPFERDYGHRVQVQAVKWVDAWPILLANALHGTGPVVSHVGSTWSNSLGAMNTLRPFARQEVFAVGGVQSFIPASWHSTSLKNDPTILAMPWTAYTYIICYREDWLKRVGLDGETAFQTPEAMADALRRLQALGVEYPWVIPTLSPYPDLVHIAASFIWGAGGEFIDETGKRTQICQPAGRQGLKNFFELYRFLPPSIGQLSYDDCIQLYAQGRVGVLIAGTDAPTLLLESPDTDPDVRKFTQTALLPGVPWVGGDNLVIWRHARGDPHQERAALELVSFLVAPQTQVALYQLEKSLPVRWDALSQLQFIPESLNKTAPAALKKGRPHQPISLWRVVEYRIGQGLDAVAADLFADPATDIDAAIRSRLEPVALRLDLTLDQ
jgi:multiple sugar transport system substrate-binding protein